MGGDLPLPCGAGAAHSLPVSARQSFKASTPVAVTVTIYRDPARPVGQALNRNWPQGFAMISETRDVTLPPGETTIRFEGVADG